MNEFEAFKIVRNRIKKFYAQMDRGLAAVLCPVLSAAAMANMVAVNDCVFAHFALPQC
jgi:hypothetical protein